MAHLLIAATRKSSGKTSIATGIAAALTRRGLSVQPFKKGPDYIDPMWLGRAAGRPCYNLDFHTMQPAEIVSTFQRRSAGADLALIESNKGLFDGVDLEGRDSNAALASLLGVPVVLVMDTTGITRGIAPLVLGYRNFDPGVRIAGLILNKVGGPRHEGKLRAALERYCDIPVFGAIGRDPDLEIRERHLGLIPTGEEADSGAMIDRLAAMAETSIDLGKILEAARSAPRPSIGAALAAGSTSRRADLLIGIARDAAFGFYYPDDLEALARAGAEPVFFDTLADPHLPDVDGLFIGGGFPETQMRALEANAGMRKSIRAALAAGMPAYAECGGLMYLSRSLTWRGERREMVGAIAADAVMRDRPVGRGYVMLEETGAGPWGLPSSATGEPARFPAHEFHYAALANLAGDTGHAYRVLRGHGIDGRRDGIVHGNVVGSFCHLRDVAGNRWAGRFVDFVRACRSRDRATSVNLGG